jgi:hypothetical protein
MVICESERARETLNADPNMSVILILILILLYRGLVSRSRHHRDRHAADRLLVYLQRPDSFDQGPCRAGDSGLARNI